MIGAIGDQAAAFSKPSAADAGRRGDAVGQQAKAAVSAARDAGAELPKNAQGLAASGIARGAEPASIFAALVTSVAPADASGDVGGALTTAPGGDLGAGVVDDAGGDGGGDVPVDTGAPLDAAPSAPLAPPPPSGADEGVAEADPTDEAGEVVQVAVSQSALSVDDGAIALELLQAAQSG